MPSIYSLESQILKQSVFYTGATAPSTTFYHLLIDFDPDQSAVTFNGTTTITVTGTVNLLVNTRVLFGALTGSLPVELTAGQEYFVTTAGGSTIQVSETLGGTPLSISSGAGTYEVVEADLGCRDALPLWVKHEVSGSGYDRFEFDPDPVTLKNNNRIGPPQVLATHTATGGDIEYTHVLVAYNATGTPGNTTGGVDCFRDLGARIIPDTATHQFPIRLDIGLVDPETDVIEC
jgi:hypothetical protein